ncbi:MAG: ATP-binding protein, partial [Acidobacteriota bacterium]|nr:ATP-binding protein [Acidobacteriota bacterium]
KDLKPKTIANVSYRFQFGFYLLIGLFLLAALFAVLLLALIPASPAARGPILLTAFVAILIGAVVCVLFLLRWRLRPYRQLVGEAERAPIAARGRKSINEGEFVLETFQSVVAQLQEQRKELERLTAQAGERADSAVRFSERIVASVPSGLIAFDGQGHSTVINAPGRALLGVDGKALGQPAATLLRNIPELAEMVTKCIQSGKVYRREVIEVVTSRGMKRQLGGTIAPIELAPELGTRGALCLLTDITEVMQLREQVALKKNLESLGEMSAGLAHEFKNAIATLHGYAQLLQNLKLDDAGQTATGSLLNEVRNLSEMVTAFLNFARPQPLELDNVSLIELLHDCVTELRSLFEERHVALQLDETGREKDLVVRADERMLRQTFLNLLRNAAEAIPDNSLERRVSIMPAVHCDDAGEWAVVEIADSGEGIPEADLERIFIPFFTTKASGHGVGLALAHRVVTQHGGRLTAANSSSGGAIFRLQLPLSAQRDLSSKEN